MFLVYDLETTGLLIGYHEIVQIGAVILNDKTFAIEKEYVSLVKPNFPERASAEAMEVNKLKMDDLLKARPDAEVVQEFCKWVYANSDGNIKHTIAVIHNKLFDHPRLELKINQLNYKINANKYSLPYRYVKDTMDLAQTLIPDVRNNLASLCEFFEIPTDGLHDALEDSKKEAIVWKNLKIMEKEFYKLSKTNNVLESIKYVWKNQN